MTTSDWEYYTEQGKLKAKHRLSDHKEVIGSYCNEYGFDFDIIQDWHIRVYGNGEKYDIYPMKKRYHNLKINKRGSYQDIFEFLDRSFKTNSNGTNKDNS